MAALANLNSIFILRKLCSWHLIIGRYLMQCEFRRTPLPTLSVITGEMLSKIKIYKLYSYSLRTVCFMNQSTSQSMILFYISLCRSRKAKFAPSPFLPLPFGTPFTVKNIIKHLMWFLSFNILLITPFSLPISRLKASMMNGKLSQNKYCHRKIIYKLLMEQSISNKRY